MCGGAEENPIFNIGITLTSGFRYSQEEAGTYPQQILWHACTCTIVRYGHVCKCYIFLFEIFSQPLCSCFIVSSWVGRGWWGAIICYMAQFTPIHPFSNGPAILCLIRPKLKVTCEQPQLSVAGGSSNKVGFSQVLSASGNISSAYMRDHRRN